LVEALQKYSPIIQLSRLKGDIARADDEKISTAFKPSPVSEAGNIAYSGNLICLDGTD
jgi:hypothetical protein